ncbi:lipase [Streptomyces albus subsp. chlorinus]|uniref:lipase family protein n=1 Tax=Streptomyces albus TaxID=1888 RepID=UPI00156F00A0|nr:lipase family protein [Streptomyces albus]NSC20753.1 lipase [Streptomyces albus subsp. chlorinus]
MRRMARTLSVTGAAVTAVAALLTAPPPTRATGTADGPRERVLFQQPGRLLSAEPSSFRTRPGRPTGTEAWRITYTSTDARGGPTTVSGTVIVPRDGRKGPRPLVSYAMGTVGIADQCAPSAHFPRGTAVEAPLVHAVIRRGWGVVVTDYEGLGTPGTHTYTVGRAEGTAVLDAARAAQRLPQARRMGVTPRSRVGLMGYSQGGQAVGWAAQLADTYAPELDLVGTAAGGVPADLMRVARHNDGHAGAGLVLMAAVGQDAAFPELGLDSYLDDEGRRFVDFLKSECVAVDTVARAVERLSDVTVRNPLDQPDWQRALRSSDLGGTAPAAPVHLYHGTADELIPYKVGARLRTAWCRRGATVRWRGLPLLGHVTGAALGTPSAARWLADRFAGKPAPDTCPRGHGRSAPGPRPGR